MGGASKQELPEGESDTGELVNMGEGDPGVTVGLGLDGPPTEALRLAVGMVAWGVVTGEVTTGVADVGVGVARVEAGVAGVRGVVIGE